VADQLGKLAVQNSLFSDGTRGAPPAGVLRLALVNCMADAALAVTEQRFARLIQAAFPERRIELRCTTLPEIPRGEMAAARIARHYATRGELIASPPDAVIFSGAEPKTGDLRNEMFWPGLTDLFGWVKAHQIPSLFSCLAAHAAVLHFSGIERRRLARKCFGVFPQNLVQPHALLRGMPEQFAVPHSRWHELGRADLAAAGYEVLTGGPDTEVDMFTDPAHPHFVFLQGHPEYEDTALDAEYRRDLRRFIEGEADHAPFLPNRTAGRRTLPAADMNLHFLRNWVSPAKEMVA